LLICKHINSHLGGEAMELEKLTQSIQSHEIKIAVIEKDVDSIKDKVADFSDIKKAVIRLTAILEAEKSLQEKREKRDEKFDKIYEEQLIINERNTNALEDITYNLKTLNIKFNHMEENNIIKIMPLIKKGLLYLLLPFGFLSAGVFGFVKFYEWIKTGIK
jgi:hypothetical protein